MILGEEESNWTGLAENDVNTLGNCINLSMIYDLKLSH